MKFETKVEKKDKGIVVVAVTMPFSEIEKNKDAVIDRMVADVEIEGFRKGKAPRETAIAKIGEGKILQEASQETINQVFPEVLKKEKLQMIGYPSISVTKLAAGNDFEFSLEMTVYPEVTLPDYKKIAKGVKMDEVKKVDAAEVAKVEKNLLDMQNHMAHQGHEHKEGEKCDHEEVTELTDDFVKQLGPFENVADFKKKLQEDLKKEAETQVISKHRGDIAEAILKELKLDLPELLVNAELDKIIAQLQDDVQKQGQDFKEFLKTQGKNAEELRESYRKEGEKRAKIEVVLKEIYKDAKLKIDEKESVKQVEMITQAHGEENLENIKLYVENMMINDAVMKYLTELSSK